MTVRVKELILQKAASVDLQTMIHFIYKLIIQAKKFLKGDWLK